MADRFLPRTPRCGSGSAPPRPLPLSLQSVPRPRSHPSGSLPRPPAPLSGEFPVAPGSPSPGQFRGPRALAPWAEGERRGGRPGGCGPPARSGGRRAGAETPELLLCCRSPRGTGLRFSESAVRTPREVAPGREAGARARVSLTGCRPADTSGRNAAAGGRVKSRRVGVTQNGQNPRSTTAWPSLRFCICKVNYGCNRTPFV